MHALLLLLLLLLLLYPFLQASSSGPDADLPNSERDNITGGISVNHWQALHLFAKLSPQERDVQHGSTGKGIPGGEPSPFSALASIAGGWKYLKKWELSLNGSGNIIDAGGRLLVPSELFTLCICSAALEVYVMGERLGGRVNSSAVIDTLIRAHISAGSPSVTVGGRPPLFSIAAKHIDALLYCEDGGGVSAGSCCDIALNKLAQARIDVVRTPEARRFLSLIPLQWPTSAVDANLIDDFRNGARPSIIWHGPTLEYLRHKLESIASLMGVCMTHTHSYPVRKTGTRCDNFRCHRRHKVPYQKSRVCIMCIH